MVAPGVTVRRRVAPSLGVSISGRLQVTDVMNRVFDPSESSGNTHLLFSAGIYLP